MPRTPRIVDRVHLSSIEVCGYRASAAGPLRCEFPGRFSVLVGPNGGGKTTICDAIYLAHSKRFPTLPRASADALGALPRQIDVEFAYGPISAESALGTRMRSEAKAPPSWQRSLVRDLGSVRSRFVEVPECADNLLVLALPATRNPIDELARREARSMIALLRAEKQRRHNHRNLVDLRTAAEHALDQLVRHPLLTALEDRIGAHLDFLTAGVQHQHAFIGRQTVDDAFLARVLELLLAVVDDRALAQRLELSGLGYVNLLHIAVTLAAIPGADPLGETPNQEEPSANADDSAPTNDIHGSDENDALDESDAGNDAPAETESTPDPSFDADEEAAVDEDSFFPRHLLHATVIIEEPEAHLHPQLHRGLVAYLKRTVDKRPEVQVILTTHSSEVVSACDPAELVVLRREENGERVCRGIAKLPLSEPELKRVTRMASLHLDASRASSLFAERVVLVEGVTDAILLRQFARAWAGDDLRRRDRVEALTVVPIGTKVGEWPVQLLATRGFELVQRLAILSDTDHRGPENEAPDPPAWLANHDSGRVKRFASHPTLEPSVTAGNEEHIEAALEATGIDRPTTTDVDSIDKLFRKRSQAEKDAGEPASKSSKKGEFAYELAGILAAAIETDVTVTVPPRIAELLEFVTGEPKPSDTEDGESGEATPDADRTAT